MKLLFKQRILSWFDSYDIYDEEGNTIYVVKGQLAWGHCLKIFDNCGNEQGTVQERIFRLLPHFDLYVADRKIGSVQKQFTFFSPVYDIDFNGWQAKGSFTGWNYSIFDRHGEIIAEIRKELFHLSDTYVIDVKKDEDSLYCLMFVLAIDAEKCSQGN